MALAGSCRRFALISAYGLAFSLILIVTPASATPISYTTWTSGTVSPTAGSATGTIPGLGISDRAALLDERFLCDVCVTLNVYDREQRRQ